MSKLGKREAKGEREKKNPNAHGLKIIPSQAQKDLNKKNSLLS